LKRGIVPSIFPLIQEKSNDILSSINNSNSDHNYAKCSNNQVNKLVRRELFIESYELDEELPNKRLKLFEVMLLVIILLFNKSCIYIIIAIFTFKLYFFRIRLMRYSHLMT